MRTVRHVRHGFSNRLRVFALALLVGATAATGILSAGCETDDSSSPLPPAVKDATTDHAPSDEGGSGGEAASEAASPTPEASPGAEGGVTDGGTEAGD